MPPDARDDLEEEIQSRLIEYGGLLDRKTVEMLIQSERGELDSSQKLSEISKGDSLSIRATIVEIGQVRQFNRKDGSLGMVVNLAITDGTEKRKLVLWNEETDVVEEGIAREGGTVILENCYVKETSYGIEITTGKFGKMVFE